MVEHPSNGVLSKYIYITETQDGYFYVGKHSWPGQGIDPNYFGSGKRLNEHHPKYCRILEDTTSLSLEDHAQREVYWIKFYATLLGVAPVNQGADPKFMLKYSRKGGRLLNCHDLKGGVHQGSGEWWLDYYGPYTLPEISLLLGQAKSTVPSCLSTLGVDKHDSQAQFFYNGHWIHRRFASRKVGAPSCNSKKAYVRRADALWKSTDSVDKLRATWKSKRPRYRLQDGFEGDYIEVAAHIGFTGKSVVEVSSMLRGARKICDKWSALRSAIRIW